MGSDRLSAQDTERSKPSTRQETELPLFALSLPTCKWVLTGFLHKTLNDPSPQPDKKLHFPFFCLVAPSPPPSPYNVGVVTVDQVISFTHLHYNIVYGRRRDGEARNAKGKLSFLSSGSFFNMICRTCRIEYGLNSCCRFRLKSIRL